MTCNVLHTTVIPVYRKPVVQLILSCEFLIVVRIDVTEVVPGGACPLRHCICLTLCGLATLGTSAVYKVIKLCKGAFAAFAGLEVFNVGKSERKLLIRNAHHTAVFAMNDRNRLTPVSLAVECPVLHLELNALFADALCAELLYHSFDRVLLICISVKEIGVDHFAVACISFNLNVAAADYGNNVNAKLLSEVIVSLVMCRNCHDSACTVAHHNVVRDINGDLLAVYGVNCCKALDANACLILNKLSTLEFCLLCAFCSVSLNLIHIGNGCCVLIEDGMLGSNNHKCYAEECIGTGCIYGELFVSFLNGEVYESTCGLTDPVYLLHFNIGKVIYLLEALKELIGILCDAEVPYVLGLLDNIAMADIALTALGILIGKNYLTAGAVVYECLITEHESVIEHLEEYPLCPLIVVFVCSIYYSGPIEGKAYALKLLCKLFDIHICYFTGMDICFDSVVFCRKTEGVKANGEKDVIALHSSLSGNYFKAGICLDMTNVHTCSAGIGKFYH